MTFEPRMNANQSLVAKALKSFLVQPVADSTFQRSCLPCERD
jgi:hypothetical protein